MQPVGDASWCSMDVLLLLFSHLVIFLQVFNAENEKLTNLLSCFPESSQRRQLSSPVDVQSHHWQGGCIFFTPLVLYRTFHNTTLEIHWFFSLYWASFSESYERAVTVLNVVVFPTHNSYCIHLLLVSVLLTP